MGGDYIHGDLSGAKLVDQLLQKNTGVVTLPTRIVMRENEYFSTRPHFSFLRSATEAIPSALSTVAQNHRFGDLRRRRRLRLLLTLRRLHPIGWAFATITTLIRPTRTSSFSRTATITAVWADHHVPGGRLSARDHCVPDDHADPDDRLSGRVAAFHLRPILRKGRLRLPRSLVNGTVVPRAIPCAPSAASSLILFLHILQRIAQVNQRFGNDAHHKQNQRR